MEPEEKKEDDEMNLLEMDDLFEEDTIFDPGFVTGTERAAAFLLSPGEHIERIRKRNARKKSLSRAILGALDDELHKNDANIGSCDNGLNTKLQKYVLMSENEAGELSEIVEGTKDGISYQKRLEGLIMKYSMSLSSSEALALIGVAKAAVRTEYMHALNVAFLSVLLSKWSRVLYDDFRGVFLAGLLHDYGRIAKGSDGAKADWVHTADGYRALSFSKNRYVDIHTRNAALMHHEYRDGSGYPVGLIANDIDVYAQVVALANDFIRLIETGVSQPNALMNLLGHRGRYNKELLNALQNNVTQKIQKKLPDGG